MPIHKNTACRYCHSQRAKRVLSLGQHPPSNSFLRPDQIATETRYPLDVYLCSDCSLVQLFDVVPAEAIFDDYLYLSSSSTALTRHYGQMVGVLSERFHLKAGDVVVDIGCNDGILLKGYRIPGLVTIGVEPSRVSEVAEKEGFIVLKTFFGPEAARDIVAAHGHARIITATNVFAHVDDIDRFVSALPLLMGDEGVFIIEAPYLLDMVDYLLFDTIYHEHLCYLSLTPIAPFLARHGLEVFDVERVPMGASGPAFRVFVRKSGNRQGQAPSVAAMLAQEETWGVRQGERFGQFAKRVEAVKGELLTMMDGLLDSGATIGGYGAPAKGNTLLNYLEVTPRMVGYIAETNPLKQGMLTPGSHIPIISEEDFLTRMPDYALLLSWNYLDFFLDKSEYVRRGGRFIVPLPSPRVAP